ncbi:MAG: alkaline shock response membrane anchor protein AmaP [Firmicutes bacterium]|nr:alkaline shock response membrane anchor protein AmaP [Bacillota bacterium]
MNLRWYDRVLIALSGLLMACLGVLTTLVGVGVVRPDSFGFDVWPGNSWQWTSILVLAGLLLLAWGAWLMVRPFIGEGDISGRYYTLQNQEAGDVHISVQALDHLVHKVIGAWPQILSAHVRITGQENAMRITLRASIQANVRIPELIDKVRAQIKRYVEECAGVKVESVTVIIVSTKDVKQDDVTLLPPKGEKQNGAELERVPLGTGPEPFAPPEESFYVHTSEPARQWADALPEDKPVPEPPPGDERSSPFPEAEERKEVLEQLGGREELEGLDDLQDEAGGEEMSLDTEEAPRDA